jgi:hypothetical protein
MSVLLNGVMILVVVIMSLGGAGDVKEEHMRLQNLVFLMLLLFMILLKNHGTLFAPYAQQEHILLHDQCLHAHCVQLEPILLKDRLYVHHVQLEPMGLYVLNVLQEHILLQGLSTTALLVMLGHMLQSLGYLHVQPVLLGHMLQPLGYLHVQPVLLGHMHL